MLISELCRDEKERQNKTYGDIAEKAGLPVSTVANFLSHTTKAPSVYTVGPVCSALGISLDEYFSIIPETEEVEGEDATQKLKEKIEIQDEKINTLEDRIVTYKRVLRIAAGIIFLLIIACGFIAFCKPIQLG